MPFNWLWRGWTISQKGFLSSFFLCCTYFYYYYYYYWNERPFSCYCWMWGEYGVCRLTGDEWWRESGASTDPFRSASLSSPVAPKTVCVASIIHRFQFTSASGLLARQVFIAFFCFCSCFFVCMHRVSVYEMKRSSSLKFWSPPTSVLCTTGAIFK